MLFFPGKRKWQACNTRKLFRLTRFLLFCYTVNNFLISLISNWYFFILHCLLIYRPNFLTRKKWFFEVWDKNVPKIRSFIFHKLSKNSIISESGFGSVTPKFNITQCYWYGFSTERIKLTFYQNICCTWSDAEDITYCNSKN